MAAWHWACVDMTKLTDSESNASARFPEDKRLHTTSLQTVFS
jgi:hypothetical protein